MPKERKQITGGKMEETIRIVKPDLTKEKYMQSNKGSPDVSLDQRSTTKAGDQSGTLQGDASALELRECPSKQSDSKIISKEVDYAGDTNNNNAENLPPSQRKQADQPGQDLLKNIEQFREQYGEHDLQAEGGDPYLHERITPLCQHPTGRQAPLQELDPKSYAHLPSCWTQRIRPAGKLTYQSEGLYNVLVGGEP